MSDSEEIDIRPAVVADVPLIHAFICELADFERLRHEVVATETQLRETLFGDTPRAEVLIATLAGEPAGFALYFHNYSTFLGRPGLYLEDLYVREQARDRGIGRRLLARLALIARQRGCRRLEWWVLDWNEPAIRFYKRLGAEPMQDFTVYRATGDALERLAREADRG
ncbi:MAG TPA: GNAT family N-acetyltransferase [Gammaproteobacteria bacterium]|nr:GNAT family N-acetyltransferase [Gammaproteobacteria bacterium]